MWATELLGDAERPVLHGLGYRTAEGGMLSGLGGVPCVVVPWPGARRSVPPGLLAPIFTKRTAAKIGVGRLERVS